MVSQIIQLLSFIIQNSLMPAPINDGNACCRSHCFAEVSRITEVLDISISLFLFFPFEVSNLGFIWLAFEAVYQAAEGEGMWRSLESVVERLLSVFRCVALQLENLCSYGSGRWSSLTGPSDMYSLFADCLIL